MKLQTQLYLAAKQVSKTHNGQQYTQTARHDAMRQLRRIISVIETGDSTGDAAPATSGRPSQTLPA